MNKNLRKAVIAGNWKMNKTPSEALEFVKELSPIANNADCDVIACVPFVCLQNAIASAKGSKLKIGAQNLHWEAKGAIQVRSVPIC